MKVQRHGAKPAPLGYRGYPKSVCASVNEVICHGIPGARGNAGLFSLMLVYSRLYAVAGPQLAFLPGK